MVSLRGGPSFGSGATAPSTVRDHGNDDDDDNDDDGEPADDEEDEKKEDSASKDAPPTKARPAADLKAAPAAAQVVDLEVVETGALVVLDLQWNADSDILAVCGCCHQPFMPSLQVLLRAEATGDVAVQLWSSNNYHWYLKQTLSCGRALSGDKAVSSGVCVRWDPENAMRLCIIAANAHVRCDCADDSTNFVRQVARIVLGRLHQRWR